MPHAHPTGLEGRRRKMPDTLTQDVAPKFAVPHEVLLGYRLWRVHHLWHRHIEGRLKTIGLSRTQYLLLAATYYLISEGEAPSQIRLSHFTLVEKMVVSKTLRALEKRGYLSRKPTPADRRANRLQVTAAGGQMLQRALAISKEAHAAFFHVLGDGRERIDRLLEELIQSHS
jgi:DNA-binding MarR family transcriptional regulator